MAGNFWQSSHCAQWVLDKVDLARERKGDLEVLTDDEYCKIMIFYSSFIQNLGEQLKLRQQVVDDYRDISGPIFPVQGDCQRHSFLQEVLCNEHSQLCRPSSPCSNLCLSVEQGVSLVPTPFI